MSGKNGILKARSEDIARWVDEALHGLGHYAKPIPVAVSYPMTTFHQGVALWSRDVTGTKAELQDTILGAVTKALVEGTDGLVSRGADPSWGWRVVGVKDISGDPRWMAGMPKFSCFIEWKGPRPATWPNQIAFGMKANLMSHANEKAPTWGPS